MLYKEYDKNLTNLWQIVGKQLLKMAMLLAILIF